MSENIIPIIYEESKVKVLNGLKEGYLDYLDLADWTFQDKFFAFLCNFARIPRAVRGDEWLFLGVWGDVFPQAKLEFPF